MPEREIQRRGRRHDAERKRNDTVCIYSMSPVDPFVYNLSAVAIKVSDIFHRAESYPCATSTA